MKIVFVITNAPPLMGGLEKVCLRVAQQMQRLGHTVVIVGRFTQDRHSLTEYFRATEPSRSFECEGVPVRVLTLSLLARLLLLPVFKLIWRKETFPLAKYLYVAAMRKQLEECCRGANVVHFFGNGPEMLGFAAEAAARRCGSVFAVEPALHEGQWGDQWFDVPLYRKADLLLVHSEYEAGIIKRLGSSANTICTVVNGVDPRGSGVGAAFRERYSIMGPMVLFLGRKTREKGVLRLLEAWPMVIQKYPKAELVFAGPGMGKAAELADGSWQMGDEMEVRGQESGGRSHAAERDLGNYASHLKIQGDQSVGRILDLDDLGEEEKQNALDACALLCVPSEGESFGMVYFEAWAYKKPVVALDLPVLRETIGASGGGILVEPNALALAKAICDLLSDPESRRRSGERGAEMAEKHSWESAGHSCLAGYNSARAASTHKKTYD
jgi:glycosyltransferase involved in cell wall biosynthesis